jgi:hypothetical protein
METVLPTPSTSQPHPKTHQPSEEVLVPDARAELTPAQMVERKLVSMLRTGAVPVSHLQSNARRRPQ